MGKSEKKRRTQQRQARRSLKAKKRAGKTVKKLKGAGLYDAPVFPFILGSLFGNYATRKPSRNITGQGVIVEEKKPEKKECNCSTTVCRCKDDNLIYTISSSERGEILERGEI